MYQCLPPPRPATTAIPWERGNGEVWRGDKTRVLPKLTPRSPPAAPQQPLADRPLAQRPPGRVVCARPTHAGPSVDRLVGGTSDRARLAHVVREEPADDPLAPLLLELGPDAHHAEEASPPQLTRRAPRGHQPRPIAAAEARGGGRRGGVGPLDQPQRGAGVADPRGSLRLRPLVDTEDGRLLVGREMGAGWEMGSGGVLVGVRVGFGLR
eukprot:scaffold26165_cov55-Phaeocystis_antarctica.AAC.1